MAAAIRFWLVVFIAATLAAGLGLKGLATTMFVVATLGGVGHLALEALGWQPPLASSKSPPVLEGVVEDAEFRVLDPKRLPHLRPALPPPSQGRRLPGPKGPGSLPARARAEVRR